MFGVDFDDFRILFQSPWSWYLFSHFSMFIILISWIVSKSFTFLTVLGNQISLFLTNLLINLLFWLEKTAVLGRFPSIFEKRALFLDWLCWLPTRVLCKCPENCFPTHFVRTNWNRRIVSLKQQIINYKVAIFFVVWLLDFLASSFKFFELGDKLSIMLKMTA